MSLSEMYPNTVVVVQALQAALQTSLSLSNRTQEAHWNVKGENFGPLHELFGGFYDFLIEASDLVAERIVQLDGQACACPSGEPLFGDEITLLCTIKDMAETLAGQYVTCVQISKEDPSTNDICIELARETEKWLWKIEAHTQKVVQAG